MPLKKDVADLVLEDYAALPATITTRPQCAMRFCNRAVSETDPSFCGPVCRAYAGELLRDLANDIRRAELVIRRSEPEHRELTIAFGREVVF